MIGTEYANTDFDLKSRSPFDALHRELDAICRVLHYTHGGDGNWHAIVEAKRGEDWNERNAEKDIRSMFEAIADLSPAAKAELDGCYLREFNIGFHCWDSWGYVHQIPLSIV